MHIHFNNTPKLTETLKRNKLYVATRSGATDLSNDTDLPGKLSLTSRTRSGTRFGVFFNVCKICSVVSEWRIVAKAVLTLLHISMATCTFQDFLSKGLPAFQRYLLPPG